MAHHKAPPGKVADDSVTEDQEGDPKNVGKSTTRRGEDVSKQEDESGRFHLGHKGKSERAHGTSTARDSTGVDPQEPIDKNSPTPKRGG
jgi:hypothetical protein